MSSIPPYLLMTQEEQKAGFIEVYIAVTNEYQHEPSIKKAIVYKFGWCDILLKDDSTLGGVEYSHKKYGSAGGSSGREFWQPPFSSDPDFKRAIRLIESNKVENLPGYLNVNTVDASPTMALCCPNCSHQFKIDADVIETRTMQACPECDHKDSIKVFTTI